MNYNITEGRQFPTDLKVHFDKQLGIPTSLRAIVTDWAICSVLCVNL